MNWKLKRRNHESKWSTGEGVPLLEALHIKSQEWHIPLLTRRGILRNPASLEIHPRVQGKDSASYRARDAAEVQGIDIQIGIVVAEVRENRFVQNVDRIDPQLKLLRLRKPHSLDQVHVEVKPRGPFNPLQAETADFSRSWIRQENPALRIHDDAVAECALESLQRRYICPGRIGDHLEAVEVRYAVRKPRHFSDILREIPDKVRRHDARGRIN